MSTRIMEDKNKIILNAREAPTHWVNLLPDLPDALAPPLHPGTMQPIGPEDLSAIFPMGLILQEVSTDRKSVV